MNPRRLSHWLLVCHIVLCLASAGSALEEPSPNTLAAKITVANCQSATFSKGKAWTNAPAFLDAATIFEPDESAGNQLQFEVIEGGVVLLAASWAADGDNTGDWRKGRATTSTLLRDGWTAVAWGMLTTTNNQPDPHVLFRRLVKAGELFKLHTRQKHPPLLLLPAAQRSAEVVALPSIAELQPSGSPLWKLATLNATASDASTRDFADEPKLGRVLVGLRVTTDFNTTRLGISSIQPIYENSDGRIHGPQLGQSGATDIELQAKPGYAVGAVIGSYSKNVTGLNLIFMRRTSSGLDPNETYASRWVGSRTSEAEVKLGGDGCAIGGLRGKVGDALKSLELLPAIR